jgi:penicillin amidase
MSMKRLALRVLLAVAALCALLAAAAWWAAHASVPTLDGEVRLQGLAQPVTVGRDERGTVVVQAATRLQAAQALGFVHAQERFFEMDLARRSAAGELSELVGPATLAHDRTRRAHRLRATLTARYAGLDANERALLQAYADGVNAGLAQLGARPWQYLLLRAQPRAWQPVDSLLVIGEMFWMLQGSSFEEGLARAQLRECAGDALFDWLEPRGGRWDGALDGSVLAPGALPGPALLDLRKPLPPQPASAAVATVAAWTDVAADDRHEPTVGSNSWAVAGARSLGGDAMLANDMHLGLGVPSIWFRTQLEIGRGADAIRAAGVTLPGVPTLVVGSNGHVAWGFTNSYGQWFDWVKLGAEDARRLRHVSEIILVKGAPAETLDVALDGELPVVASRGAQQYALRWVGDAGTSYGMALDEMLQARDALAALRVAARSGIPQQNILVADDHGQIGWTIAGGRLATRTPDAQRFGRFVAAADLAGLDAPLLTPASNWLLPLDLNPPDGQLWTANARTYAPGADAAAPDPHDVESPAAPAGQRFQSFIGDGGVDLGARAQQIRDRLRATPRFDEASLGAIQFDDEALFMRTWAARVAAVAAGKRPEAVALLQSWNGRADADQAGYRLVRELRRRTLDVLWSAWTKPLACAVGGADWHARFEYPATQALDERPPHLLPRGFASWDAFLLDQLDATIADMTRGGQRPLAQATWGERNASRIGHPLSRAVPALARWLDMPSVPQSGDGNMPRVAGPGFGQSERLVVAPGHEERAILALPGGQSGHPLSPYYGAGHADWVAGRPTPLLAGPAQHLLTLAP